MSDKLTTLAEVRDRLAKLVETWDRVIAFNNHPGRIHTDRQKGETSGISWVVDDLKHGILSHIPADPPAEPEKPAVRCPECGGVAAAYDRGDSWLVGWMRCGTPGCPCIRFRPDWFEGKK